jgi:L-lactate dehydrogenase complex protein LldE
VRVALFATCLGDRLFAEACADAVRLLRHAGATVDVPSGLTCCGQPALNAGYVAEARRAARHTLEVLSGSEWVVLPSGSCAGMVRHHLPGLLEGEERRRAEALAKRTWELSAFLVHILKVERLGNGLAGRTVAYHHGCHALRMLDLEWEPVSLLTAAGAEVVAWEAGRECCGFGGLFSTKLPAVSAGMADRKLDTLPEVDVVTSADGGCLLQLSGRAARRRDGPSFRHLASVLWEGVGPGAGARA